MSDKKIAIVTNSTWNIYNFRQELIRAFKLQHYKVIVIAPIDEYIHYLNESYFTKHISLKYLEPQGRNLIKDLRLLHELYEIFKIEKPDIILSFTIKPNVYGSLAAKLLGIPCISTLTGLGYAFTRPMRFGTIFHKLFKYAISENKKIIFHNQDDLELLNKLNLVDRNRCQVIPGSGIDTNKFKPMLKNNTGSFIFLFVGRLLIDKGILEYIKAANEVRSIVKNVEFWVVGQLNEENPISIKKEMVLEWVESRQIKYLGAEKDVRPYIKEADVLVLPSYREGLPKAILEAMSMQKAIITTKAPGCKETVIDGLNGFKVTPKDHRSLAEAMVKMYNLSDQEIFEMGLKSRELAIKKYDINIILDEYISLTDNIIGNELKISEKLKHH